LNPAPPSTASSALTLTVSGLCVEVARRRLVQDLKFSAAPGQFIAVLGENGVGKTLTLHTLAGLRPPAAGSVQLGGRDLRDWPRRELALALGLLAQSSEDPFPSTVLESALIGRHPHLEFWQWESEADEAIARTALKEVDLAEREDRAIDTLSGGERRRLAIATILTQDPGIFLLDEATNHLDPHHQSDVLACFRARADARRVVIATLHDATLAARYADQALLLYGDGSWSFGPVAQVLDTVHLSRLYRVPVHELEFRGRRVFVND
jgi:iron complex transport system ATP-binding protein